MLKKIVSLFLMLSLLLSSGLSAAAQMLSLDERVKHLEGLLNSQVLTEQQQQIEQVKAEINRLQEALESQNNKAPKKPADASSNNHLNSAAPHIHADPGSVSKYVAPPQRRAPWMDAVSEQEVLVEPKLNSHLAKKTDPVVIDHDGYESYQYAFNKLMSGKYKQAINEFSNFIHAYPNSRYLAKSHFWLGEANYLWRDYNAAITEYRYVLNNFPKSNKRKLAALKMGFSFYKVKDWASSKSSLQQVIATYPKTVEAKKAKEKLKAMKREGY